MVKRLVASILVVAATYAGIFALVGTSWWGYIDIPSFLLVPLAPAVFVTCLYGLRGMGAAFTAPFQAEASRIQLELSVAFFKDFSKVLWCFGALGTTFGFIAVLRNLTEPSKLGPNLAVAILTMMYAATFNLVLVVPPLASARRRIAGMEP